MVPSFRRYTKSDIHTKDFDIEIIKMIKECFGLKFYILALDKKPLGLPSLPIADSGCV